MAQSDKGNVSVIKANFDLQRKVGKGPIDESVIRKSQNLIDNNTVDFSPVALEILDRLLTAIEDSKNPKYTFADLKQMFTTPVMELKANAAIFHYDLVGQLAAVMLGFLERIKIIDADAIDIVRAHHTSLHMIASKKISGPGGAMGESLVKELQLACDRYYNKKFDS